LPCDVGGGEVVEHGAVDQVGEASFEAAQGFSVGLALGAFAQVVGAAFGVGADLGDGIVYSARFSRRLPERLSRCRLVRPEEAGMGAEPLAAANACLVL
jgi:hypothetical protein